MGCYPALLNYPIGGAGSQKSMRFFGGDLLNKFGKVSQSYAAQLSLNQRVQGSSPLCAHQNFLLSSPDTWVTERT